MVFISEIVPKPAISWVANVLYKEHYSTMPVRQLFQQESGQLTVGYTWIYKGKENNLRVTAGPVPVPVSYTHLDVYKRQAYGLPTTPEGEFPWTMVIDGHVVIGGGDCWYVPGWHARLRSTDGYLFHCLCVV